MATQTERLAGTEYLVETDWLEAHLDDDDLRIYDCGVMVLANPDPAQASRFPFVFDPARTAFEQAHIPRAGFIDVPGELSDQSSDLPLTLPSEKQFCEAMGRYGIDKNSRVVLYGTTEPNWPARVWWMLRAFGFDNALILNGGWGKWTSEERAVSNIACNYPAGRFIANHRPETFVNKEAVLSAIEDERVRVISGLPAPMYQGTSDFTFGRKGRIAGSVNVPFSSLHDPVSGCYLAADQLQNIFNEVDVGQAESIINYCGSGIAASNNAFALTLLGYSNVSVYDGSMFEWGNNTSLPMEKD